ncbi:hypothetical protein ACEPAI_9646 [Sanghuangporus weigelae]
MVASGISDSKRRRHTYAERTVTAISDIRRHHPRSPIHLKTLKAQIRRNAIAQDDALGPRWRTGVNLACKLLTDQGVLDPEHPPGRIVISPKGKQLIARTRHSIGLPDDHEHNQECDENLGRKVMHRLSYAPARARRATSVATAGEEDTRKAPSKLTRAELLEENKKLRQEYEALKHESSRRLAELNADLEDREDEWLEYQDLASARNDFSSDIGDITLVQDDAQTAEHDKSVPARPETSIRAEEINVAETTGANIGAPRRLSENRSSNLLIRTNTGSFISSISKRPTPAPSDPGSESIPSSPAHDMTFDPDVTLADALISPTRGQLSDRSKVEEELRSLREQLGTAEGMRRALQIDKEKLQEDIERLKMDLLEKTADLESVRDLLLRKDQAEERALETQNIHQRNLEGQLADLQQELRSSESIRQTIQVQLEKTQTVSEGVKNSLQETIKNLENELTGAHEREELLLRKAQVTQDECERLQVELQASMEETNEARNELAIIQAKLYQETTDRTRLETDLATARERIALFENTVSSLRSELLDVQTVLQTETDGAQKMHDFLREVVDELRIELEAKQGALVEAQSTIAHREAELALLRKQLSSSDGTVTALRTSLAMLESKTQNADAQNALLREELKDAEEEVAELKDGYERLKRTQLAEFEEMDRTVTKKCKRATMPPLLVPPAGNIDIDINADSEAVMPI